MTPFVRTRALTPERWVQFLDLVVDLRGYQREYKRTLSPSLRTLIAEAEELLDVVAGGLVEDLATHAAFVDVAGDPVDDVVAAIVQAEGGAA